MKNIYHHVKGFSVDAVPASTCHTRVGSRVGRAAFSPDQKLCINVYQCWANNFNVGDLKHLIHIHYLDPIPFKKTLQKLQIHCL